MKTDFCQQWYAHRDYRGWHRDSGDDKMTPNNRKLIESIIAMIDQFAAGEGSISDVQSRLQSIAGLIDREPDSIEQAVRAIDADLEEIQFARLLDEQRPATIFLLDGLRAKLEKALADPE